MSSITTDRLDGLSSSVAIKGPCRVATTANIALYGLQTIDGVLLNDGDRVLVKDQTAAYENGIYVVDTGQWRRSRDFNKTRDIVMGTQIVVVAGLTNAGPWSVDDEASIIVGTTAITFTRAEISPNLSFAVWDSGATKRMTDRSRREAHIADFSVDPTGANDDTAGIRQLVAQGQAAKVPIVFGTDTGDAGKFALSGELEITQAGQKIRFESTGYGGYGDNGFVNWKFGTTLIGIGTFPKRVRTRRNYRASAADAQDDAMSCMLNIQAEGVELENPSLWLDCDYSNLSPTNLGANCDIGIGVFTRTGVKIIKPVVTGYFRKAGMLYDVTNGFGYPRMLGINGSPYPDSAINSGGDGCLLDSPQIRGGRVGLAIVGAKAKAGQTDYTTDYYDQQLGTTIADRRGSAGFSDFLVLGGEIYGPDHHSNWRRKDPELIGGLLTEASLANEPDYAPCAMWIDGLASNPRSVLWGMRFVGTRFASYEAMKVRLDGVARASFYSCHVENRADDSRLTATGAAIGTANYTTNNWGSYVGTSRTRGVLIKDGNYIRSQAIPNFYCDPSFPVRFSDYTGREDIPEVYASYFRTLTGDAEVWGASGGGVRLRSTSSSLLIADAAGVITIAQSAGYLNHAAIVDIRGQTGGVQLRQGSTTVLQARDSDITVYRNTLPNIDATRNLGSASLRFNNSYFAVAPTVGSDERLKKVRGGLTDEEIAASSDLRRVVKIYQLLDSVKEKGEDARLHAGWVAQEVVAIFEKHGLDWRRYGIVGEDELIETVEVPMTVSKPKIRTVTRIVEQEVEEGDSVVLRSFEQQSEEAETRKVPLLNEGGDQIFDDYDQPIFRDVVVYEDVEETTHESRPVLDSKGTPVTRFSLRMEELLAFIVASIA